MPTGIHVVRSAERLRGALTPLRRTLLEALREPASATELAARVGASRQRINYHIRELEQAGLVELVELRARRGCTERVMRATARAVVVDPEVIGDLGAEAAQDRFASDTLLAMAARTVHEVARQRDRATAARKRLLTFAIETDVGFATPADVERFATELAQRLGELAARYDTGARQRRFRVVIGGHPAPPPRPASQDVP